MKKALLFLFIIQLHLCTNAQNKILFRIDSTHSGNIMSGGDAEGMAGNSAIRGFDHHVSPAPGELTNSFPSDYDFPKGLNSLLNSFQLEHLIYHEIRPGYSLFGLGNYYSLSALPDDAKDTTNQDSLHVVQIRKVVFQHHSLLPLIYSWAMPYYQSAFEQMSVPEQNDYLALLNEAKTYTQNFDLARETNDLRLMADTFAFHKGKLQAFIFRRIYNGELSKEECIAWVSKIISDLSSVKTQHAGEIDNYVVYKELSADYFLCTPYQSVTAWRRNGKIVKKRGNSYEMTDYSFSLITYEGYDMIAGTDDENKNKIFYCGNAAASCFPVDSAIYGTSDMLMGNRLLVLRGSSYDGENMACTLIDIPTGKIILSKFTLPVTGAKDPYTGGIDYNFLFDGNYIIYQNEISKLYGILSGSGEVILPAKYSSIKAGKNSNQFILNKRKKIMLP